MRIPDMKIGVRPDTAFTFVIALLTGTIAVGIQRLDDNNIKIGRIVSERHSLIALSNRIKNSGYKANGTLSNLLLVTSADQKAGYMNDCAAIRQANGQAYDRLEKTPTTDASRTLFKEQFEARSVYGTSVRKFFEPVDVNKPEDVRVLHQGDMSRLQDQYCVLVDKMVDRQASETKHDTGEAITQDANAKVQMIVLAALTVLFVIATGGFITHTITGPIHRTVHLAKAIAQGDLTYRFEVDAQGEIDRLLAVFRYMAESPHGVVDRVCGGMDTITHASREAASGNIDLSSQTEQQTNSLEETAVTMEQLISTVEQSADNAQEASHLVPNVSLMAAKGGDVVGEAIETMSTISVSSRRTADIIDVIDSIMFQANILALNVAVEVACVSEQGQDFAVVAGEVCNLVQRSVMAAKRVKGLIKDPVDYVSTDTTKVGEAGQIIRDVVAGIQNMMNIAAEISTSSREQNEGIERISEAITQVSKVTQENAPLVEGSVTSAQVLQDQADQLAEMVSIFRLHSNMPGHAYSVQGETATVAQVGWARVQTLS